MILQRFARALRAQDWTAALIEVVIVILGIVIGLQITDWYEKRDLNERRDRALAMIQGEFEENIYRLDERIEYDRQRLLRNEVMIDAVATGNLAARDAPVFEQSIAELLYFAPVALRRNVARSLEQSGDMALIDDTEVLITLNGYAARVEWIDAQHGRFSAGIADLADYWRPYVELIRDPESGERRVSWDLDGIRGDIQARSGLTEVGVMHAIFASYIRGLRDVAWMTCERLGEHTGMPCEVQEPSAARNSE